jgi:hypothetical protein
MKVKFFLLLFFTLNYSSASNAGVIYSNVYPLFKKYVFDFTTVVMTPNSIKLNNLCYVHQSNEQIYSANDLGDCIVYSLYNAYRSDDFNPTILARLSFGSEVRVVKIELRPAYIEQKENYTIVQWLRVSFTVDRIKETARLLRSYLNHDIVITLNQPISLTDLNASLPKLNLSKLAFRSGERNGRLFGRLDCPELGRVFFNTDWNPISRSTKSAWVFDAQLNFKGKKK